MPTKKFLLQIKTMSEDELFKIMERQNVLLTATENLESLPDVCMGIIEKIEAIQKELHNRRKLTLGVSMASASLALAHEDPDLEGAVGGVGVRNFTKLDENPSGSGVQETETAGTQTGNPFAASHTEYDLTNSVESNMSLLSSSSLETSNSSNYSTKDDWPKQA